MSVQLLDGHHSSWRDLVESNEDPVLEQHIYSNRDDTHEQHNILLLDLDTIVPKEDVQKTSPSCTAATVCQPTSTGQP
jgi:hypothetical protein